MNCKYNISVYEQDYFNSSKKLMLAQLADDAPNPGKTSENTEATFTPSFQMSKPDDDSSDESRPAFGGLAMSAEKSDEEDARPSFGGSAFKQDDSSSKDKMFNCLKDRFAMKYMSSFVKCSSGLEGNIKEKDVKELKETPMLTDETEIRMNEQITDTIENTPPKKKKKRKQNSCDDLEQDREVKRSRRSTKVPLESVLPALNICDSESSDKNPNENRKRKKKIASLKEVLFVDDDIKCIDLTADDIVCKKSKKRKHQDTITATVVEDNVVSSTCVNETKVKKSKKKIHLPQSKNEIEIDDQVIQSDDSIEIIDTLIFDESAVEKKKKKKKKRKSKKESKKDLSDDIDTPMMIVPTIKKKSKRHNMEEIPNEAALKKKKKRDKHHCKRSKHTSVE